MIKINRGLDLPITGEPAQVIEDGPLIRSVALVGYDYHGMKPTMAVRVGDRVKKGQVLFTDKKTPGVNYTAPASGIVTTINRGIKRVFESLVINVEGDEEEIFAAYPVEQFASLSGEQVRENLVASGLWTALRTRPFSKVPAPGSEPHSIFVAAMDSNPLAANPEVVINEHRESFVEGLVLLSRLTEGTVFVAKAPGSNIPLGNCDSVVCEEFAGPHPAGLVGTHIHFLDPVHENKTVWTVGYQDVIAIAKLFETGRLYTDRVVALAGPVVERPRLLRTRLGASTDELIAGELEAGNHRVISGSVLSGRKTTTALAWLGRYHDQVCALQEGTSRELFGWLSTGKEKHSVMGIYLTSLDRSKRFRMTTSSNGSPRAMVPIGAYEQVMPLDILPTQLLRALIVGDLDMALKLGALELDDEDLALCTYVCPGKYEYGQILRDNLTQIELEG
jgi:Na+-transporting NADH:ubiquinone oxidoreductase subunit A